jgi:sterol 22-desaturase
MVSFFDDHSAFASLASPTSQPHYTIVIPTLLSAVSGKSATWLFTTIALILGLLALEQSVYRYKKRHLPGDKWTIPIIGKLSDSMKPTMEGYKKQWDSGALSAVSVFNM